MQLYNLKKCETFLFSMPYTSHKQFSFLPYKDFLLKLLCKTFLPHMYIRAEVIMLSYIILFRISCSSSALCSSFHALFSRSLSKQSRSSQDDTLLQSMTILLE